MFVITFALTMYLSYGNSSMIRRPDRQSGVSFFPLKKCSANGSTFKGAGDHISGHVHPGDIPYFVELRADGPRLHWRPSRAFGLLRHDRSLVFCCQERCVRDTGSTWKRCRCEKSSPLSLLLLYSWCASSRHIDATSCGIAIGDFCYCQRYWSWVVWVRQYSKTFKVELTFYNTKVSGYGACALLAKPGIGSSIFNAKLASWVRIFYALAVVQNVITTSLMAYRIWTSYKRTSACKHNSRGLLRVIRILIESAAIQLIAELVLLVFYSANMNAQYIVLEAITPLVVRRRQVVCVNASLIWKLLLGNYFQRDYNPSSPQGL